MTSPDAGPADSAEVETAFRAVHGRAVATLVRVFGDITLAEDAVQDAFVVATTRWPTEGIPANPAGWIITTARNRAIDQLRRQTRGRELEEQTAEMYIDHPEEESDGAVADDQLRLIFTCCHPAIRLEHRVALTLRLLGGLTVEEIARSFLVGQPAMAKRLVRARYKIKSANIPYPVPSEADLPARLRSVLAVVYLIYNTGADEPSRAALRSEAIRLGRSLVGLMPDEPEAAGLLALLLLSESRMPARTLRENLVLLRNQDRSSWDARLIEEGQDIVLACVRRNRPGPYQLQAAIQAVHCDSPTFESTDWEQIVALYDQLYNLVPTSVVALNRAIAIGETEGAESALRLVDDIADELDTYHLMHAVRGTMLRRLGRVDAAKSAFERAADLTVADADRRFLASQIDELASSPS